MPDPSFVFPLREQEVSQDQLFAKVEEELERFSQFMENLPNWKEAGPLTSMERALLKTYILHKVRGSF